MVLSTNVRNMLTVCVAVKCYNAVYHNPPFFNMYFYIQHIASVRFTSKSVIDLNNIFTVSYYSTVIIAVCIFVHFDLNSLVTAVSIVFIIYSFIKN